MRNIKIELMYLNTIDGQVLGKKNYISFITWRVIIYKHNRGWINWAKDQVCISSSVGNLEKIDTFTYLLNLENLNN